MNIENINVKVLDVNDCININGGDKFTFNVGYWLGRLDKWAIDQGYINVW